MSAKKYHHLLAAIVGGGSIEFQTSSGKWEPVLEKDALGEFYAERYGPDRFRAVGGAPQAEMPAPTMTLEQAINLYHAAFLPDVVGATTDGEVFRETPASALARHLGLPHYVFATRAPGAKQTLDREAAADILYGWARALKAQS